MTETLHMEPTDVYEPPLLVEVGNYGEFTQSIGQWFTEGDLGLWG